MQQWLKALFLLWAHQENSPCCQTMFLTDCRRNDDLCRVMNHRDVQHILTIGGDSAILTAARRAFEMPEQEHNDLLRRCLADMIRRTSRNDPQTQGICCAIAAVHQRESYRRADCLQARHLQADHWRGLGSWMEAALYLLMGMVRHSSCSGAPGATCPAGILRTPIPGCGGTDRTSLCPIIFLRLHR